MNTAEKIASVYLRLNGFLQLPLFTVFDGNHHNHMDLLGVRMANSKEVSQGFEFPLDEDLFTAIANAVAKPKENTLKLIAEVRSNKSKDIITEAHFKYAEQFLGGGTVVRTIFYEADLKPTYKDKYIQVGIQHAISWTLLRIQAMEDKKLHLTKEGSWYVSEEWLADILILRRYGVLNKK